MSDWTHSTVRDVISHIASGPSPTCEERNASGVEWGLLKTTAATWDGWNENAHKVPPREYWGQVRLEVQRDDVVITKAGPRNRVGVVVFVPQTRPRLMVSGKMVLLRPDRSKIVPRLLADVIASPPSQKYLDDRTAGMAEAQTNFANSALLTTPLLLPPVEEQRRIAEILDSIDETVQVTKRIIAKLEVSRQGLLDDLLGAIMRHEPLGENLDRIDGGWSPACAERPPSGAEWGVLKVSSITREDFNPAESKTLPRSLPPRPDLIVRVGDVLTARANGVADLVGRTAFVDHLGGRNLLISDKTLRLVPGPNLSPRYLSYCMQHEMVRRQVRGLISGSTGQGNISQAELRSLWVAIPPRHEQHAIESVVASVDGRLMAERHELSKLRSLRGGVAADLLSGRVRTVAT